jgi:hypothetical protein
MREIICEVGGYCECDFGDIKWNWNHY